VLHIADPEVTSDLVQRGAVVGSVTGIADPDLIQDRRVPGKVESGRGEVRPGLPAGQLIQQRAEAGLGKPAAQLIKPGQFPDRCGSGSSAIST
jgi:hypothetical protein